MIKEMTSRGMFPEQVEEIISLYIEQNRAPQMQDIWYRSVDKYPREVLVVLWLDVKDFAAEWIRDISQWLGSAQCLNTLQQS